MTRHVIGKLDEFPDDTRRVVDIDGEEVAVFNVRGAFHALRNACPHKGAPLCTLPPTGMMLESAPDVYEWGREGEIVRCPWHGFEFNLSDGKSVVAPQLKLRARVYKVDVEGEEVALYV
ncbi:Rieske (2Fe-2S) protein [Rhodococcus sp. WAY2]|uniref:Rieske (2Fe-2S) protein n=1 Tax=Rhodococcus sp. WAY2 TaxID=2663121 RepID=UPI0013204C48|nr:Rieske (2Fe-2S) protein [Rhodococcus sp. WAY2]QHE73185.1 rieske [2Fe-2S] domain protein [Rhodococcus sp. WAY2]